MKQKLGKWTLLLALFCLAGCGTAKQLSTTVNPQTTPAPAEPSPAVSTDPLLSPEIPEEADQTLVVYFSATGNTKPLAEAMAEILQADLYEIVPAEPYTTEDLNYNDNDSRSSLEMNDETSRPALAETVENFEDYSIVVLAYLIWWGQAPRIVSTFVESVDFTGKIVIPFCTSGSSGIGSSAVDLQAQAGNKGTWLEGRRFAAGTSREELADWIDSLALSE